MSFEGLSGRIEFDSQTGYVDRIVDIYQINDGSVDLVAYYNAGDIVALNQTSDFISSSFVIETISVTAPLPAAIVFIVLTLVAMLLLLVTQILSIIHHKFRSVKAASPNLNHLAYAGCYILVVAVVSFTVIKSFEISSQTQCHLWHVLNAATFTGSTLIFGIVLAKTWRLYRILVHFLNPGRLISDRILFIFTLLLATFDVAVNAIWIAIDPFTPTVIEVSSSDNTVVVHEHCSANSYFLWFGILAGYNLILMLASVWLAILCHQAPAPKKEFQSNSVIFLVYSLSLILIVGLTGYFLSPSTNILLEFVSLCLTLLFALFFIFVLLFLPPILPLLKHKYLRCIFH